MIIETIGILLIIIKVIAEFASNVSWITSALPLISAIAQAGIIWALASAMIVSRFNRFLPFFPFGVSGLVFILVTALMLITGVPLL